MTDNFTLEEVEDTFREGYEAALEDVVEVMRHSGHDRIHVEALIEMLEHMMGFTDPEGGLTVREMLDVLEVNTPDIYYMNNY